ncbi:DUF3800 domain-containing protein [Gleimia europaea]|uniref:DUF3800 domain-containing protein n=1 Tax=Gleimia europaea TaxID=66228 RepID=UPI000688D9C2|nr:DUF3800 domain-containing protein [Gleimia europaea]
MTVFIYADESGVFDQANNELFVFGGLVFLSRDERDRAARMYRSAERSLGAKAGRTARGELKATTLSNKDKGKMFRSLNSVHKFAAIVDQTRVHPEIYKHKKSKQRYLDFVFKIAVKRELEHLRDARVLATDYAGAIDVRMDEHTTATDGRYELREALEMELKIGTYNQDWDRFFPPVFPNLSDVRFCLRDSIQDPLIRAADIVANRVYYLARSNQCVTNNGKVSVHTFPRH